MSPRRKKKRKEIRERTVSLMYVCRVEREQQPGLEFLGI